MDETGSSVLFVCVANSCRSQMAEAVTRALVGDRWEIWSAGSRPSRHIHAVTVKLMAELGLDLSRHYSKGLDDVPSRRWDYVITMGCGDACPHVEAVHRIDWDLPDPVGLTFDAARHVRDRLVASVRQLCSTVDRQN